MSTITRALLAGGLFLQATASVASSCPEGTGAVGATCLRRGGLVQGGRGGTKGTMLLQAKQMTTKKIILEEEPLDHEEASPAVHAHVYLPAQGKAAATAIAAQRVAPPAPPAPPAQQGSAPVPPSVPAAPQQAAPQVLAQQAGEAGPRTMLLPMPMLALAVVMVCAAVVTSAAAVAAVFAMRSVKAIEPGGAGKHSMPYIGSSHAAILGLPGEVEALSEKEAKIKNTNADMSSPSSSYVREDQAEPEAEWDATSSSNNNDY